MPKVLLPFKKTFDYFLVFSLLVVFINNYGEVVHLFRLSQGEKMNLVLLFTSPLLKILKDLVLVIAIVMMLTYRFYYSKFILNRKVLIYFLLLLVSFISFLLSINEIDLYIIFAGVRWFLPLLLGFLMVGFIDIKTQKLVLYMLSLIFLVGFFIQIYQVCNLSNYFGINYFGYSLRNPGFYIIPNSMAFFSTLFLYYVLNYSENFVFKIIMIFFVIVSIYLTASGTGVLALVMMMTMYYVEFIKRKQIFILIPLFLLLLICLACLLKSLTGRSDIFISLSERISLFSKLLSRDFVLFSSSFGKATNTALMLSANNYLSSNVDLVPVDSTYGSILANTGIISFFLFIALLISLVNYKKNELTFLVVFGLFSFSTILFEVFPMNILFAVNIAYLLKKRRQIL